MQEITQNFEVQTGDIIELDYKILSLWEDAQIEAILNKINEDGRMEIAGYEIVSNNWYSDVLKIQIRVLKNPFPLVVLVVAIASIATAIFVYLSLDKMYLISREVPEVIAGGVGAVSLGIIAVIGLIVFMIFSKAHG